MNAYQEVERLSESVRAGDEAALDKILVLARAYMEPDGAPYDKLRLRKRETRIFNLLLKKRGQAVSKEAIHSACYFDFADEPEIDIIDVWICKLRSKLKGTEYRDRIETVRGYGYRLAA
jgi:two-component system cell cycle response regulator CtrA